jgi:hypothetical protein
MTAVALCLIAYLQLEAAATHEALALLRHELLTQITDASGPWRSGGEWWSRVGEWKREEREIGLVSDGHLAIYRVFRDCDSGQWFMEGMYD